MKLFLDTANVEDIKRVNGMGVICGVTTNPSLIAKEGRDFTEVVREIASIVDGPISGEVNSDDAEGMIAEAMEDLFHFPVCKYPEERAFDLEDVLTRVLYYKKEIEKLRIKKMSRVEIRRYIDKLTKKKLKKELKRRKLDYEGLDYEERKALLEERFKEI